MDVYTRSYVLEPSTLNALSGALRHKSMSIGTMREVISAFLLN